MSSDMTLSCNMRKYIQIYDIRCKLFKNDEPRSFTKADGNDITS